MNRTRPYLSILIAIGLLCAILASWRGFEALNGLGHWKVAITVKFVDSDRDKDLEGRVVVDKLGLAGISEFEPVPVIAPAIRFNRLSPVMYSQGYSSSSFSLCNSSNFAIS